MYLPTAIALQLKDDSKVTVEIQLEDLIANSQTQNTAPNYLQLGKGLTISRVDPNPMYVKSEVEISGFGFSAETTANTVEFRNALNELVSAEIVSASNTILKVIVPDDAVTGLLNINVNGETVQTNVTISETKLMLSFGQYNDITFQVYRRHRCYLVYIGSFAIDVIVAIWLSVLILLEFKHLRSGNVNNQTAGS